MPDFLTSYLRNSRILREPIRKLKKAEEADNDEITAEAVSYLSGDGSFEIIKAGFQTRFATGIENSKSPNSTSLNESGYDYYTRGATSKAIDMGHYPIISTGLGSQIAKGSATLTTQPSQRYEYLTGATGKRDDKTAEIMKAIRENGGYDNRVASADFLSMCVESCVLHSYWAGRKMQYDTITRNNIKFIPGNKIIDDGIERGFNPTLLEDYSAVIIRMAVSTGADSAGPENSRWLAYVGSCGDFLDGRMVSYTAQDYWPIPDVGSSNAIDYRHNNSGDVCNPLSYLANHGGSMSELARCEYPIAIFRGGHVIESDDLMPLATKLYNAAFEVDMSWSQVMKTALESARGKDILTRTDTAGAELPKSLDVVVCEPGITYDLKSVGTSNSMQAAEVIKAISKQVAGGFSMPGYQVVRDSGQPESALALQVQTRPMLDARRHRTNINKDFFSRQFNIERGILAEYTGKAVIGADVVQLWDPGEWIAPRDEKETLDNIAKGLDTYMINQHEGMKKYYPEITTDEEAEARIKKYQEQDPSYTPFAAAAPASPFGKAGE